MRILMLTATFAPEPHFKGLPFAKDLIARGHQVQVLTGFPHWPGGKLYPGYRVRLVQRETVDGVPVLRVPVYPSHDRSPIRRIATYLSLAFSMATIGVALVDDADVVYVMQGPATLGLPAVLLKWLRRMPFVYDIQDLWPDTLGSTGMMRVSALLGLVSAWCRFVYRRAARIVVLSPGFKKRIQERGVPADKVDVIHNWCDESQVEPDALPATELTGTSGPTNKFRVVYAGTMGAAQGLDTVLEAARILSERNANVAFLLIGGGVEADRLRERSQQMGLQNVTFLGRRPVSDMSRIYAAADALLVHLRNDPLFEVTIPSKTQAYLAVGKPILMGVSGDAATLVQDAEAGYCFRPESPEQLAAAVDGLSRLPHAALHRMGSNGRRFYEEHLSQAVGVTRLLDVFEQAARPTTGAEGR